jgi:hypothetical protein
MESRDAAAERVTGCRVCSSPESGHVAALQQGYSEGASEVAGGP